MSLSESDQLAVNTIRFLAVDMVEAAKSGHPGAPMGQAPLAYKLWTDYMAYSPERPNWPNRDRFVLSCGHASALLYALLHLAGYDLPMDELENFRQLGSKTPGHPEHGLTPGVETTTGPLGQGISTAVGMAMAEQMLAARFNREESTVIDYRTWVLASDGDLMEGIASEASSMAGHFGLGKLTVFYDDNQISIDGPTDLTFSENVARRYEAYGWHVVRVADGNDLGAIGSAIESAQSESAKPTLVIVPTHIGFGSPNRQDTAKAHGEPLGGEERQLTKKNLGWPLEPTFYVPNGVRECFDEARARGQRLAAEWDAVVERYRTEHPELAAELDRRLAGELPNHWAEAIPSFSPGDGPLATRKASGKVLNAIAEGLPELIGGSADLAGSNNTTIAGQAPYSSTHPGGRNLHFGVREHAMGAALNGMALGGGIRPYGGTFLVFSDYMRPAIRLAALMKLPVIYVFTHDSIFLGEDGPTHQPVSHLVSLRSIPGLTVLRPADAVETAEAWRLAIENREGPTALVLTRQSLPVLTETIERAGDGVARGGYVLADPAGGAKPRALLLATGSEVSLCLSAHKLLAERGIATRVVSLPCRELFDRQDEAYRDSVLPADLPALAVEAAVPLGWHKYVGRTGAVHAQEGFGESAPAAKLAEHFGFTPEAVARRVEELLA